MFRILTPRLILREMKNEDADDLFQIFSDPEAMKFYPSTRNLVETKTWVYNNIERYARHGFGIWAVQSRIGVEFLGQCGLILQDVDGKQDLEIGYMFLRRHWGQGFATEAASACRDYAFERLDYKRVVSLIDPGNIASRRVAEKVGMKVEKEIFKWNKNVLVYSLSKERIL
jgi:RimJ/RimL family protein N-acetyltransferase